MLTVRFGPGLAGLVDFCDLIGESLHPHEKRIARAYFGPVREVCAILPRGNAKTTLAAKIGVHPLLSTPGAMVTIGAASVAQARICFERMKGFAQHPALADLLVVRHLELRHEDGGGLLARRPLGRAARPRALLHAVRGRRGVGLAGGRRAARGYADGPHQAARLEVPRNLDRRGAARHAARPDARARSHKRT